MCVVSESHLVIKMNSDARNDSNTKFGIQQKLDGGIFSAAEAVALIEAIAAAIEAIAAEAKGFAEVIMIHEMIAIIELETEVTVSEERFISN
jgi:hypothetical protein